MNIRMLSMENNWAELVMFINFLVSSLIKMTDFDLLETYMSIFIKIHGDTIKSQKELRPLLDQLHQAHKVAWEKLSDLLQNSLCLIGFLGDIKNI